MNHQLVETQLREAMCNKDFTAGRKALMQFHAIGGTADEALDLLKKLRTSCSVEFHEDFVLEMLDIASGWCSPTMRVWT